MNNLFTNQTEVTVQGGANQLSITAQLTNEATRAATEALAAVIEAGHTDLVLESQTNAAALDKIVDEYAAVEENVNIDALKEADEETLTKAMKSQQSKRSRSKSSAMTESNYVRMLSAAIAESAIRIALGKPRGAQRSYSNGSVQPLTDELVELYTTDQQALAKAIRNVQSKKSIYKGKADFDPTSNYWNELLSLEQQLKELRGTATSGITAEEKQAIEAKELATNLVADVDPKSLKADEAKQLLAELKEALAARS